MKNFPQLHIWCKVEQFINDHLKFHAKALNLEDHNDFLKETLPEITLPKFMDPTGGA